MRYKQIGFPGLKIFIADEAKNTDDAAHRRGFLMKSAVKRSSQECKVIFKRS